MASIIEKVKQLALPLDELVVIGGGLLDALGYRQANDIDLAVSDSLYAALREGNVYQVTQKHNQEMLEARDIEVWRDWGPDAPFATLKQDAITIDGVSFANPAIIIEWKQRRDSPKDRQDVKNLQEYFATHE